MSMRKKILFSVILGVLVLASLEIALSVLTWVSPEAYRVLMSPALHEIPDDRLGIRPNPRLLEHDEQGFRNLNVPTTVDIVALGDSQTYGASTEPQEAWPQQLQAMSGHTVYQMAYGGYGPAHSWLLWPEAQELHPDVLIQGFYSGNDLFDSFALAAGESPLPDWGEVRLGKWEPFSLLEPPQGWAAFRRFLSLHSKLYGVLRVARLEWFPPVSTRFNAQWADVVRHAKANDLEVFEQDPFRTVFTPKYRLTALSLNDPRIAEGLRISLAALRDMHDMATLNDQRFFVVLIPTKELVFADYVEDPSPAFQELVHNEQLMWARTQRFLHAHGIESVDALPALRGELGRGVQPYHPSRDGHPNRHGYRAIARLVHEQLQNGSTP